MPSSSPQPHFEELPPRIILHVDIDSFYPSVEMREAPTIIGKPVIVGADPKDGKARGVVVSCSYEARKLGVRSGMPISRAFRLAGIKAVYLRPNFPLYISVSKRVMAILRGFGDKYEQVSIDEAFLDCTEKLNGNYDLSRDFAFSIKEKIKSQENLTCSIGVAPNKSSAKIASDFQKPDGLTVVRPENLMGFLAPLPSRSISGIGSKTEAFLDSIGVRTIGDLQKLPSTDLRKHFGKTGVWLWGVANGLERIEVKEKPMRSLGAEHTFDTDISDQDELLTELDALIDRLHERIRSAKVSFRIVGIRIRFSHFQTFSRENTLPTFTFEKQVIRAETRNLLREFSNKKDKVRLIGVYVSDFRDVDGKASEDSNNNETSENLEAWIKPEGK